MIAREVGEDRGVERHAIDAAQRERVRGDFHGGVRAAGLLQFVEDPVQIERFGRRVDGGANFAGHAVFDGPDHGGGLAGGAQNRIDQECCGGLSVGAGDAGEAQALIRLSVEVARGERQRLAAVLHLDPGSLEIFGRRKFADDGDGAARDSSLRELCGHRRARPGRRRTGIPPRRAANHSPTLSPVVLPNSAGSAAVSCTPARICSSVIGRIRRERSARKPERRPGPGTCARATPLPVNSTGMPSAADS